MDSEEERAAAVVVYVSEKKQKKKKKKRRKRTWTKHLWTFTLFRLLVLTTSETKLDHYHQKVNARATS